MADDFIDEGGPEPIEGPSTEITKVLQEGDPEDQLRFLEKKAQLAPRFKAAIQTILVNFTYPEDWKAFGSGDKETICLTSAGAERVARQFNIKFYETKSRKELIDDNIGKGYRYVFEGKAAMNDRIIYAQGVYSTRDKFLGYANEKWKDIADINENHIRNAAYHIYLGNGIKGLLGLRGMPRARWEEIFGKSGESTAGTTKVTYAQGKQGGTSADDAANQQELYRLVQEMAQANLVVTHDQSTNAYEAEVASDSMEEKTIIETSISALSEFKGDKGWVGRKKTTDLKGKWLATTLKKAKEIHEKASQP
jgi:hypothetical protein